MFFSGFTQFTPLGKSPIFPPTPAAAPVECAVADPACAMHRFWGDSKINETYGDSIPPLANG